MPDVKVWCRLEIEVDGVVHTLGRRHTSAPFTVSTDGDIADLSRDIASETTVTLFDKDNDLSDFDLIAIESDRDVVLELTTDKDGSNGTEYATVGITGDIESKPGVPFILARDDSFANYTAGFGGGTLDKIEVVKARNRDASNTAHVRCLAVT